MDDRRALNQTDGRVFRRRRAPDDVDGVDRDVGKACGVEIGGDTRAIGVAERHAIKRRRVRGEKAADRVVCEARDGIFFERRPEFVKRVEIVLRFLHFGMSC